MNIPAIIKLPPNRVWRTYPGGKILDSIEGKVSIYDDHFPEDWIASTTLAVNEGREAIKDEGLSKINLDGQLRTLKSLIEQFPEQILGVKHYSKYGAVTQFLVKFLDSAVRLHIQAHPTIPFAQKYLNSNSGKTEAYIILNYREEISEPYIYLGFKREISQTYFKELVEEQKIEELLSYLNKIRVNPGDVFIVPGGLPHAIGEGIFMIEIMEPTDFVVRLEFKRGDYILPEKARFMGRNIDFALQMINFTPFSDEQIKNKYFYKPKLLHKYKKSKEEILIDENDTKCFSVIKLYVKDSLIKKSNSFYVGIITKGEGIIILGNKEIKVKFGDKFLIPFKTTSVEYKAVMDMEVILAFPPKI
jgi:mannose-6-phosphate isomerase